MIASDKDGWELFCDLHNLILLLREGG